MGREIIHIDGLLNDASNIIEQAKRTAYAAVNVTLVARNWLLGKRIAEEDMHGMQRAEYGKQVIQKLSEQLTEKYGEGFGTINLWHFVNFHKRYSTLFTLDRPSSEIVYTPCKESQDGIIYTACKQSDNPIQHLPSGEFHDIFQHLSPTTPIRISWSHYRILLQEDNADARAWYEREAAEQAWSVKTLQRNISSQYYYRLLQSPKRDKVEAEMQKLTAPLQDPLEYMKNPVIAEFLGYHNRTDYTESDLEQSILDHLQEFLRELGKGFAFVDRQKHIYTEKRDYYIDLVFYNFKLKCFVLIDLKTDKIDYQDVGQMDMYVKMFDEKERAEGDNPTIGILLCADTDEDVARYSSMHDNDQLFAAKYLTYMPTKEELRREIEQQKQIFEMKKKNATLRSSFENKEGEV